MKNSVDLENKNIFITGSAGFIGSNLVLRLLSTVDNARIIGVDSMTDYNPIKIKEYRLKMINEAANNSTTEWIFFKLDISNLNDLNELFKRYSPSIVINLAAQAGVRYSLVNPQAYIETNIIGFFNVLEVCKALGSGLEHLVFASSSSVYGGRENVPFRETDNVDSPVSLYAATKKSNELLAFSYSKLYNIPCTGLRFFTVYGPCGRTDMAYFSFTEKLRNGENISVFNYGNCERDFTYIDDIIDGIIRVMKGAPKRPIRSDGITVPPYSIYNIGNSRPIKLVDFVHILAEELILAGVLPREFDIDSHINLVPMQAGDVPITYADTSKLEKDYDYKPSTDLRAGLKRFAVWYREFYL